MLESQRAGADRCGRARRLAGNCGVGNCGGLFLRSWVSSAGSSRRIRVETMLDFAALALPQLLLYPTIEMGCDLPRWY